MPFFRIFLAVFTVAFGQYFCLLAESQAASEPPALSGWSTSDSGETRRGIKIAAGDVTLSAPAIAEVDGNQSNGREVVVGSADGYLSAYRADGSLLWSHALPIVKCSGISSNNRLLSSPAVGALFGDGVPYVVVGYGGIGKPCTGGVAAIRGSDGTLKWNFSTQKFSRREKFYSFSYSVFSSPALADTDGDGQLEVAFGSFDRNVYLLNANGKPRWYYNAADTVWSSPAFAEVDGDSKLELVFGTDISRNRIIRPPTRDGGYLYAFNTEKQKPLRILFRTKQLWRKQFNQVLFSSPVIANVLPNSPGMEVAIGSGCFFPQHKSNKRGKAVKVLRLLDGKLLKTLNTSACSSSTVAVGDIDDDGQNEIVATVNGDTSVGGDGKAKVMAWKADSEAVLWTVEPNPNDSFGGNFMSPIIADVDGNGSLEVVVAMGSRIHIFNGRDGSALTCQGSSCAESVLLRSSSSFKNSPAVGDLDGDGVLEIIASAGSRLYSWTSLTEYISSTAGTQSPYSAPWPMFRGRNFSGNASVE